MARKKRKTAVQGFSGRAGQGYYHDRHRRRFRRDLDIRRGPLGEERGEPAGRDQTVEIQVPAEPKIEFKTIVVASAPLRFGMELDRAQLTEMSWPQDSLPQGAFADDRCAFRRGTRVVLSPMEANEPVLLAKLSGANGRATLSNLLTPGMRAVTIKTDEIAGVGGFITPGDRVDIVLTRDAGEIEEVSRRTPKALPARRSPRRSSSRTPRC